MSQQEKTDILKAYTGISLAFGILLWRGQGLDLLSALIISALTVGIGFIFHELAHRYVARKYGVWAEFRSFDTMLMLAILMSCFGFILAAPGAVMLQGRVNKERAGRVSAAGPVASMIAAGCFIVIGLIAPTGIAADIGSYGAMINSWLALFNLIPLGPFDGAKVRRWNKKVWLGLFAAALVLVFVL